jgi:hypothetical protein
MMMVQMRDHAPRVDETPPQRHVTCEDFQSHLPELVAAGQDLRDHEHLKTCARCTELLEELEYIAGIASDLLLPVYEPGEAVWKKISASLPKTEEASKINGHLNQASADS